MVGAIEGIPEDELVSTETGFNSEEVSEASANPYGSEDISEETEYSYEDADVEPDGTDPKSEDVAPMFIVTVMASNATSAIIISFFIINSLTSKFHAIF